MGHTQCLAIMSAPFPAHPPGGEHLWGRGSPREAKELSPRMLGAPRGGAWSGTPPAAPWPPQTARQHLAWHPGPFGNLLGLSVPACEMGRTASPECELRRGWGGMGAPVVRPAGPAVTRFPTRPPARGDSRPSRCWALGNPLGKTMRAKATGGLAGGAWPGPSGRRSEPAGKENKNMFCSRD